MGRAVLTQIISKTNGCPLKFQRAIIDGLADDLRYYAGVFFLHSYSISPFSSLNISVNRLGRQD